MNTSTTSIKSFAIFFVITVAAGTALLGAGSGSKPVGTGTDKVVTLERVVIVGKRSAVAAPEVVIAQLPRVVITGRSTAAMPDVQLASARGAKPAAAKAL